ncbi:MAG TPA: NAD-glutamate dehydrogenase domain-containing protein [Anaeromyxobacter sp.]|nr:NAD-glutamate dehydrogenase domain-containing protein [Anaeromyxobacter sp.]
MPAREIVQQVVEHAEAGASWLERELPGLFTGILRGDREAVAALASGLHRLQVDRQLVLADRPKELILARLDTPGSVFETLNELRNRAISRTEIVHSLEPVPGADLPLELQHYVFDRKPEELVGQAGDAAIPEAAQRAVFTALASLDPTFPAEARSELLRVLWINDPTFVEQGRPHEIAAAIRIFHQALEGGGFAIDLQPATSGPAGEVQVLFAVENPPAREYLAQVIQVFNGLDIGVRRLLALTLATGSRPFFLGSFRVSRRNGKPLERDSDLFRKLRRLLFNTQILSPHSAAYIEFVLPGIMTGEEAALVNAFIGFCHTNCAHAQPHRYTFEDVIRAFHSQPEIALRLVRLFELRFDPEQEERESRYAAELALVEKEVANYNTGHRQLDDFRRSIFRTALIFVKRTLKSNFFVVEKHAHAFRLDPAYLEDLGAEFTGDLPPERPFRVTFFFAREGLGYHIGFSDIARGGWRTIITRTRDDFVTAANTLFRECTVLAHTQHLKNKDIYEGGSKLACVLHAPAPESRQELDRRLHRFQLALASAFLDVFVTRDGKARDARVLDYYGEDEPIELGPDENMHDEMIEAIAELSIRRGYLLGSGIMSSKRVGINHKEYGVTSLGVVTYARVAMRERRIDIGTDRFSVKLTGGPNGDVAGNAIRLLLAGCADVRIRLIVDGTAALVDPQGLDREALGRIVLRSDAEAFDLSRLSPGGFALFRNAKRKDGFRELHRRVEMTAAGLREDWVTLDEFHQEFDSLIFTTPADLFIPAGGRPETIDGTNWALFLTGDRKPSAPVIIEGANSFITPEARDRLQEAGAVVFRDASANKCGVISSSYEIIGNLLLSEEEFLAHKERYVRDVLAILEKRAADEANLLVRLHREEDGKRSWTALSAAISSEINAHKAQLFRLFQSRPGLAREPRYQQALLAHLPRMIREEPQLRLRVERLPPKYVSAILAAEIGTTMVYREELRPDYEAALDAYVSRMYGT